MNAPQPSTTHHHEAREILRLAGPIVVTQLAMMSLGTVDLLMVGRAGEQARLALGAVALGNVWKIGTMMVAMGVVLGIDPFLAQAHGARDERGLALALQRGLVLALLLSLPVALCWWFTEPLLLAFDQRPELARLAHQYLVVQIPSIPFWLCFCALRSSLQARGIVAATLYVALIANGLNAFLNWVLIYGNLGAPALGAVGSGITTSIGQAAMPLMMLAFIRAGDLQRGAWQPWSTAALDSRALWAIVAVGAPIGLHFAAEIWGFHVVTLWAGWLGDDTLAASTVVLNLASNSFMLPLGISLATSTRVGNLIGAGRLRDASTSAWTALALGAGVMGACGIVFALGRELLPRGYTDDARVLALAAATLPVAAAFQLFDGLQVVAAGILRAMGTTQPTAVANLLGYYALGLPLSWWLAFRAEQGLVGLWWGVAAGVACVAVTLVAWIRVRGPEHARVLVEPPSSPAA